MTGLPIVTGDGEACGAGAALVPAAVPVDPATCRGTFSMVSLGCPKNLVDSERMLGLLREDGWQLVAEPRGADLVIVNTCAFIDLARQVKEMTAYARDHAITIAVMGCRVNGPGETDDADLGLWCGPTHVNLKRRSEELGAFPYDAILPKLKAELDRLIEAKA